MLEKAQWERERERGLGFCYLELGGLEAGLRKEELGFSGFGCDWIYIRTRRRKMEKSWRVISSIQGKNGPWAYMLDSRATTLSVG